VTVYRVFGTGDILVDHAALISESMTQIPRVGVEFNVPAGLDTLEWHGRGPWENYVDRKQAAMVGTYRLPVKDLFVPYVLPTECGGREDVRWAALTGADGAGLLIGGLPTVHIDAHPYTIEDFVRARHISDLEPRPEITVHVDGYHMGLGGDVGWGRTVHPEYQLLPGTYRYAFRLRPLAAGERPGQVIRTALPGTLC
jgi:beta-galactosidase